MLEVKGSVAVITGGSGGIGMALAHKWLELGGKAVIADFDESALATSKEQLGPNVETFRGCDNCRATGECVMKDDMDRIVESIQQSDVIVLATGNICMAGKWQYQSFHGPTLPFAYSHI